jgi:hypothetical protein
MIPEKTVARGLDQAEATAMTSDNPPDHDHEPVLGLKPQHVAPGTRLVNNLAVRRAFGI